MDISCSEKPVLEVPLGAGLPTINSENLRTSALMDQNTRQPFTQRHLHIVGKRAYELAVSIYLVTTFPGVSNVRMTVLHERLTTLQEVISLSSQLELHESLYQYGGTLGDKSMSNAFYAWMGAVLVESGIAPVCKFSATVLEHNHQKIQSLDVDPDNGASNRVILGNIGVQAGAMIGNQENDEIDGMELMEVTPTLADKSPSKRKLSYSNSQDSLISEPGETPSLAGSETMKRRKLAQPKFAPLAFE
ncbi:hypothetical protein TWF225_005367 [Orbilia oligospora]|nr:hypothetical protein TWF225_005367 [Orbilia oligospora]KAF3257461.1 hypothetical protein TWF128_005021 [Orbilia oligospora]KAF3270686.1 hypothetical protein TWF217_006964 [Orbilia oligospora]KAF3295254.1 hypothetical protein TWF132_001951 [Orbilia oligospora]